MPKTSAVQRAIDKIDADIALVDQVRERLAATLQQVRKRLAATALKKPPRKRAPKRESKHEEPTR